MRVDVQFDRQTGPPFFMDQPANGIKLFEKKNQPTTIHTDALAAIGLASDRQHRQGAQRCMERLFFLVWPSEGGVPVGQ